MLERPTKLLEPEKLEDETLYFDEVDGAGLATRPVGIGRDARHKVDVPRGLVRLCPCSRHLELAG